MASLSREFGRFAHEIQADALPPALSRAIRARIVDVLGVACAASRGVKADVGHALAGNWGAQGPARIFASTRRVDATGAAFVNALLAHCEDFDDTHLPSVLHPSATIIPTALAVAEERGRTFAELIAAAAVGYELCIRLGMAGYDPASHDSLFFARGWHATSICGALGASASAAKLMGLDARGIAEALAVAASLTSGILEANRGGGSIKAFHCAYAAQSAILAARSASLGVTGPARVFEGEMGLFRAYCGITPGPELGAELGSRWSLDGVVMKRFPINHFLHPVVDAALELRARVPARSVAGVTVGLPRAVLKSVAEPRALKLRPATGHAARFSAPFVFATAWESLQPPSLADFDDDSVRDPQRLSLAELVECEADPVCTERFPKRLSARVRVDTHDGRRFWAEAGEGPRPALSPDAVLNKFEANLGYGGCEVDSHRVRAFLSDGCTTLDEIPWPVARDDPRRNGAARS
ncbi:MAG: MmgE/PrpD family protein [Enhygromyxa sp.]